jgi:hypothetical protein
MERDDDHKKWVWKRDTGPDRHEKDEDGRATARQSVEAADDEVADEVSPIVSLWRSALTAMQDAVQRTDGLKQQELDELEGMQIAWGNLRAADGEPN